MKLHQAAVSAAVSVLEEAASHAGWDEPPVLFVLHAARLDDDHPDPRRSTAARADAEYGAVGITPMAVPETLWARAHPRDVLRGIADAFLDFSSPLAGLADDLAVPSFVGVAFLSEGWENSLPADQRDGRQLADIPGSVEVRTVACVDTSGRYTLAHRVRGQRPTTREYGTGGGAGVAGAIPAALRDMVLGVARRMRPDDADIHALAKLISDRRGGGDT